MHEGKDEAKYNTHRVIDIAGVFRVFTKKYVGEQFLKNPESDQTDR
jgi:hypothetical protein